MDIQFYGANCVRIATKKATITVDDNLAELGVKSVTKSGDIVLFTGAATAAGLGQPKVDVKIVIDGPGEYEVSNVSVKGIAARSHMDESKLKSSTVYKLTAEDMRIAIVGHIYPELNEQQLEAIGTVDILILPVGGNGYTLDGVGAAHIIKEIEPKMVIVTHYADEDINYEVPQQTLEDAVKNIGIEPQAPVAKLKLKSGEISDILQLVILESQ